MADSFVSKYSAADFDTAMDGGYCFARGEFVSAEQMAAFIAAGNLATLDDLGTYVTEVAELIGGDA